MIFWTDIVVPLVGFLLWLQRRYEMAGRSAPPVLRRR